MEWPTPLLPTPFLQHVDSLFFLLPASSLVAQALYPPYRAIGYSHTLSLFVFQVSHPIAAPIALTIACMQNKIRGVSHVKLPSGGYRAIGGYNSYSIAVSRKTAPLRPLLLSSLCFLQAKTRCPQIWVSRPFKWGRGREGGGGFEHSLFWGAPRERRRRRTEKRLSKKVFLESPFLLCPLKVFRTLRVFLRTNLKGVEKKWTLQKHSFGQPFLRLRRSGGAL